MSIQWEQTPVYNLTKLDVLGKQNYIYKVMGIQETS